MTRGRTGRRSLELLSTIRTDEDSRSISKSGDLERVRMMASEWIEVVVIIFREGQRVGLRQLADIGTSILFNEPHKQQPHRLEGVLYRSERDERRLKEIVITHESP